MRHKLPSGSIFAVALACACAMIAAGIGLTACRRSSVREETFGVMGTVASVMAGSGEQDRCRSYADMALKRMREIETALSIYSPTSDLSRLNSAAGKGLIPAEGHLRVTLGLSLVYGALTHGAFDVTVGPVVKAWGFSGGRKPDKVLSASLLEEKRALVGYTNLVLKDGACGLSRSGMVVDLGGMAKGYAVDVSCRDLRKAGARNFVVNLGGNMRCYGKPEAGRPWRIGVRDPLRPAATIGRVELEDGMAVATSGNYERFVEIEGKRYAHIIDPRTGWPVSGMAGVTVVAPSAATADALSTSLFVLGPDEGGRVLTLFTNCAALFVPDTKDPEILLTPGMERYFQADPALAGRVRPAGRASR